MSCTIRRLGDCLRAAGNGDVLHFSGEDGQLLRRFACNKKNELLRIAIQNKIHFD